MKSLIVAFACAATLFTENPEGSRQLKEQYPAKPSQQIVLEGFSGTDIKVHSWDKNEVSITLDIEFSASRERDEQRYLESVSLKKSERQDELRIALSEPEISGRRGDSFFSWLSAFFGGSYIRKTIRGEIYVPVSNSLSAEVKYGSVMLDGMKGELQLLGTSNRVILRNCSAVKTVENNYGKTTLERCGGSLQLHSQSGTVNVEQFAGSVWIDADYSVITANDVTKSMTIRSTSGRIEVSRAGGDLTIRSNYTTITATDVAGVADIEDQSGNIRVKNADGARVRGNYSKIEISDITGKGSKEMVLSGQSGIISVMNAKGDLKIDNPYGNIDLNSVQGNVNIRAKSNRITALDVTGDWVAETEYSSYSVERLSASKVSVVNKSGRIDMELKSLPTAVDIRNEYADVNLDLPAGFGGSVELDVTYGRLETNLPLQKRKTFESSGGYAIRTVENEKGKITVETKSGNVRVMER